MHERSLVRSLLQQVQKLQTQHGAERVVTVMVSLGEFSGVESGLFQTAFDELIDDSPIRGARLELRNVPLECRCQSCSCEFRVEKFQFRCPQCGDSQAEIVRGEGLVLESVTLE